MGTPSAAASADPFQALDDSKISKFQLKIMFVSGMGFFTDAYDLFVIGIVVALIETQWKLSTSQVSWLNSATLLASAVGAIVFGRVADILGRKRIYGYEVLILAIRRRAGERRESDDIQGRSWRRRIAAW
jgi:MFS transporter, PHS family, inorganic phosphate transporter